jgi:carbon starvation protein
MPAPVIIAIVGVMFWLGYRYYAGYLGRTTYGLDAKFITPAHQFADGRDFVPTNKNVLFGHHFTSVAGAAPIVGPAIAVFWGWGPALAWIVLGTIFAAGVHDMGSLVVSVRHKAKNIGTIAKDIINRRARALFLIIIFFLLTLVNAVFAVVIGNLFVANPGAVIPIFVQIPLAIAMGQYIYRRRSAALIPSLVCLVILYVMIWVGAQFPVDIAPVAEAIGMEPRNLWVIIMFAYTLIASRLPVWVLLQPRDYINSHQLFVALGIIVLGVVVGWETIVAPVFNEVPAGSPSIFPFLFITIACGAISGFHSLVASGTTAKQLDKDTDAKHIGYGGALGEGSLAVGAVLAVTAGAAATTADWNALYADFGTASGGAVGNFVNGIAVFAGNLGVPIAIGTVFAAVVVISFAATTMDTGIRLQRYVVQEIAELAGWKKLSRNLTLASLVAVAVPLTMALLPGGGDRGYTFGVLWQLFGTTNQLTAGLALAVIAVWVTRNGRPSWPVIIPLVFLLIMTVWALIVNIMRFIATGEWVLAPLGFIILVLAMWLIVEAAIALRKAHRDGPDAGSSRTGGTISTPALGHEREGSVTVGTSAETRGDGPDAQQR